MPKSLTLFFGIILGFAFSATYVRVNQVAYRLNEAKVAVAFSSTALSQTAIFQVVELGTGLGSLLANSQERTSCVTKFSSCVFCVE